MFHTAILLLPNQIGTGPNTMKPNTMKPNTMKSNTSTSMAITTESINNMTKHTIINPTGDKSKKMIVVHPDCEYTEFIGILRKLSSVYYVFGPVNADTHECHMSCDKYPTLDNFDKFVTEFEQVLDRWLNNDEIENSFGYRMYDTTRPYFNELIIKNLSEKNKVLEKFIDNNSGKFTEIKNFTLGNKIVSKTVTTTPTERLVVIITKKNGKIIEEVYINELPNFNITNTKTISKDIEGRKITQLDQKWIDNDGQHKSRTKTIIECLDGTVITKIEFDENGNHITEHITECKNSKITSTITEFPDGASDVKKTTRTITTKPDESIDTTIDEKSDGTSVEVTIRKPISTFENSD